MGTANALLAEAREHLGVAGRPNKFTKAYAEDHGDVYLSAAWCDMFVTYCAHKSDNVKAALPGGDRAYTVWHAQDFQRAGRWYTGTTEQVNQAKPGDIVFFDWGGSNSIGYIDHVGIVEKVVGNGVLQTIEGNTGDAVKRRIRYAADIAGYGRPAYDKSEPSKPSNAWPGIYLKLQSPYMTGDYVKQVQKRLNELDKRRKLVIDGVYGPKSKSAVVAFQKKVKVEADGIVGPVTHGKLFS